MPTAREQAVADLRNDLPMIVGTLGVLVEDVGDAGDLPASAADLGRVLRTLPDLVRSAVLQGHSGASANDVVADLLGDAGRQLAAT